MLFKFFAKDTFEPIAIELGQLFETLGLSISKLKIRTQPATYFKPYTHVVEGDLDGHRFVLSLRSSALKSQITKMMHQRQKNPRKELEYPLPLQSKQLLLMK